MNKDVIYIEPEDDITDILANIKDAKNKIIALVPPKKAGVLQSAVNFKLIAKTATNNEKTVVLITSDESLLALADKVKMPTAKSLQSKPKLPKSDDTQEFGDDDADDEVSEKDAEAADEEPAEEPEEEEKPKKTESKAKAKKAAEIATVEKTKDVDIELDAKDVDDEADKKDVKTKKAKNIKVPNFKKYRKYIILFLVLFVIIFGFGYWATKIAPAAKITVKVKTIGANFNETIRFVTDETKSDPENGVFFAEQKTTSKTVSSDFEATGQVDKGAKASGTITVKVKSPVTFPLTDGYNKTFTIPSNTVFTNASGNKYVSTAAVTLKVTKNDIGHINSNTCKLAEGGFAVSCNLSKDVTANVQVVASENGEKYNIDASTSGWTFPIEAVTTVKASAMTGGSSKIVKVVSQQDVEQASNELSGDADKEAREELASQFSSEYILIGSSFAVTSTNTTTSPSLNEEVGEGVTPKIVRETKYVVYAVKKSEVNDFITAKLNAKIGDNTQMIYSTGVAMQEGEEDKAFFESYKNDNGNMSAKLKSTTKTGPRITEDMVKEVSLGEKVGKVQSNLRSYNGVSEAYVETSYFWVMRVPDDDNKVQIEITVE